MSTHTPGPWAIDQDRDHGRWSAIRSCSGDIADVAAHRSTTEANARLIAAAPDLLAALKDSRWPAR